ncbi:hypothetical protein [Nonomuraea sp. bgisy101]|uniref:hypothetical protein n=1 Tax=Nonomuraea sp. bgisy101 TaxID=3413784 RepID=UPI003D717937
MRFVEVEDPFDPWPSQHAVQRLIAECAARPGGHAWTVQGDSGESPWLACADCPATGDDAYPDIIDILDSCEYELGGRTIRFGEELPDDDSSAFKIPVDVEIESTRFACPDWIGYEYDVEIHITDRQAAA